MYLLLSTVQICEKQATGVVMCLSAWERLDSQWTDLRDLIMGFLDNLSTTFKFC